MYYVFILHIPVAITSMTLLSIMINAIKQIRCEFLLFFFCFFFCLFVLFFLLFFFIDIFIVWKSFIKNLNECVYLKHILCINLAHTRYHYKLFSNFAINVVICGKYKNLNKITKNYYISLKFNRLLILQFTLQNRGTCYLKKCFNTESSNRFFFARKFKEIASLTKMRSALKVPECITKCVLATICSNSFSHR